MKDSTKYEDTVTRTTQLLKRFSAPAALILIGAILRYLFIYVWHEPYQYMFSDIATYLHRAREIAAGKPLTEEHFFQPIGMTYLEALLIQFNSDLFWLSVLQFLTSVATLALIWDTTRRILNEKLALIALAIATFHYPFIFMSGVYLSECIYTFLLGLFIWMLSLKTYPWNKVWGFFLGLVFMMGFLFKGNAVVFAPLMGLWVMVYAWKNRAQVSIKSYLLPYMSFALAVVMVLVAHGLFTEANIGHFQMSASAGGLNLVEGKCPYKNNSAKGFRWWSPLFVQLEEKQAKTWDEPFTNSSYYTKEGLKCIAENPVVLLESLRFIPYLFINNDLWPSLWTLKAHFKLSRNYNLFFAFLAIPGLWLAFLILCQDPKSKAFLIWILPALGLFIIVWLMKSEIRLRVPHDVVFIPLITFGWNELLARVFTGLSEKRRHQIMLGFVVFAGLCLSLNLPV